MAKKQFKAESKRLLDLMINSIYTHREIFLREIISNASDALDKRYYASLTDSGVGVSKEDLGIVITSDKENRVLTVSDNGIGMSMEELENNLGVIARSGTLQFKQQLDDSADISAIGQFGVGFYSAFMVSSRIRVITRRQGADTAYCWESTGADGYTITEATREEVGTDVIMELKEDTEDDKYSEFLEEGTIGRLVKKFSNYIRYPISGMVSRYEEKAGSTEDKPEYEKVSRMEVLNSMIPLWNRPKSEVTTEEYNDFYRQSFGDYSVPHRVIHMSVEGQVTFKALLFIPSQLPYDFYMKDFEKGLRLFSNGVMIMDKCGEVLPDSFRFVRGLVDSPDLSLNISREILQHDRQLRIIAKSIEKRIRTELDKMLANEREEYEKFYGVFGRSLKYQIASDFDPKSAELADLLLFASSKEGKLTTLAEYVERMPQEQQYIYYATGESMNLINGLPQAELLNDKGYEMLYFTEEVDEFDARRINSYKDKEFRSVNNDDLGIEAEDKETTEEVKTLQNGVVNFVKETLGNEVKEVVISKKLKSHAVCLSAGMGMSFEMEKYFSAAQPDSNIRADRVLEMNPEHPVFAKLRETMMSDPVKAADYARILYVQAQLMAGLLPDSPNDYTDMIYKLM